jgi:mRNA interferase YafQ
MRKIEHTNKFKRDFKRESKGLYRNVLETEFRKILIKLANDDPLEEKYHDHSLTGNWKDCRDCHVKPDLILIYSKPDSERLQLIRLGSHSELGI